MPKSKVESPAVVHGKSDTAQGDWFRNAADGWRREVCSVRNGKGSGRRPRSVDISTFASNWDLIDWGKPKIA